MLFRPLHMRATLDASMLNEAEIMPITRVLPYRAGQELRVTALGRHPLQKPNPLCHYIRQEQCIPTVGLFCRC